MRSNPLLLFLVCFGVAEWARRQGAFGANGWHHWLKVRVRISMVLFALAAAGYVVTPAYFDHVEPSVASVSWVVLRGEESHPGLEAIGMYGFAYGPMLYLFNGYVLDLFGPSILASKLAGALAALGSVAVLSVALSRTTREGSWSCVAGWTTLLLMTFGAAAFWVRAEPLLLLCSSVALLGLTLPPLASVVVVGLAAGVGINLKVTSVIYLLPALVLLWQRSRTGTLLGALVVATVVAAMPFAVSRSISPTGYWYWIQAAANHGIRPRAVITIGQWALFILLPLVAFGGKSDRASVFRAVLIGSVLASVPLAAKYGTGPYHFVPFIPSIGFCAALIRDGGQRGVRPSVAAALFLTCALLAAVQLHNWLSVTGSLPSRAIVAELRSVESKYEGPMAMGYASNYRVSFYRPLLVFDGHPLVLDPAGMMDRHWTRDVFPRAAFASLAECRVKTWLIPRGGSPFLLPNAYPREGSVVPDEFRSAFETEYSVVERGEWFDVWRCHAVR